MCPSARHSRHIALRSDGAARTFVGLNARHFAWQLNGPYAEDHIRDNWERLRPEIYARVGGLAEILS
jgi:hypothetical protein